MDAPAFGRAPPEQAASASSDGHESNGMKAAQDCKSSATPKMKTQPRGPPTGAVGCKSTCCSLPTTFEASNTPNWTISAAAAVVVVVVEAVVAAVACTLVGAVQVDDVGAAEAGAEAAEAADAALRDAERCRSVASKCDSVRAADGTEAAGSAAAPRHRRAPGPVWATQPKARGKVRR